MPLFGTRGAASVTGFGGLAKLGYLLRNSLRFRSSASAYLNRTPAGVGNRTTFTWSGWVKRGTLGTLQYMFCAGSSSGTAALTWTTSDTLEFYDYQAPSTIFDLVTSQVFRDPAAWYHIVAVYDSTQASSSNRVKLYVNGVQITAFGTASYPSQNANSLFNTTIPHTHFGRYTGSSYTDFNSDAYLAEVNFVDGQALTPSSFGKTDAATNQWVPKKFGGAYGTNGFYLPFTNTASTSTLGNDFSGNSNTWTVNNISLTSGSTYDSMKDVPTLTDADTANYSTYNPLAKGGNCSFSNANLQYDFSSGSANLGHATIGVTSGKWYYEVQPTASTGGSGVNFLAGWHSQSPDYINYGTYYWDAGGYGGINFGIEKSSGTNTGVVSTGFAQNDICGIALDYDGGTIEYFKNGSSIGKTTGMTINGAILFPTIGVWTPSYTATTVVNFGQRPFAYTPPSGFKALNTFNLP